MKRILLLTITILFQMALGFTSYGSQQLIMKPGQSWLPTGMEKSQIGLVEFVVSPDYLESTGYKKTGDAADLGGMAEIYATASRGGQIYLMVVIPEGCELYFSADSSHMFDGFGYARIEHLELLHSDLLENTSCMFRGCKALGDLNLFMDTSKVTASSGMFENVGGIIGIRKAACFTLMEALPSDVRFYEGFTGTGGNGLLNTELPKEGTYAYVTDPSKYAYLCCQWGGKTGCEQKSYQLLASYDAAHLILPEVPSGPGTFYSWKDLKTGQKYSAGQDLGCIRDNLQLSWHTLGGI